MCVCVCVCVVGGGTHEGCEWLGFEIGPFVVVFAYVHGVLTFADSNPRPDDMMRVFPPRVLEKCVCVCVCVCERERERVCVCVCVCAKTFVFERGFDVRPLCVFARARVPLS